MAEQRLNRSKNDRKKRILRKFHLVAFGPRVTNPRITRATVVSLFDFVSDL